MKLQSKTNFIPMNCRNVVVALRRSVSSWLVFNAWWRRSIVWRFRLRLNSMTRIAAFRSLLAGCEYRVLYQEWCYCLRVRSYRRFLSLYRSPRMKWTNPWRRSGTLVRYSILYWITCCWLDRPVAYNTYRYFWPLFISREVTFKFNTKHIFSSVQWI